MMKFTIQIRKNQVKSIGVNLIMLKENIGKMNMGINLINKVFEELEPFSSDVISYFPPVGDMSISLFEEKYRLKLPEDYNYFLHKTNGLNVMGDMIYGIYDDFINNIDNLERVYIFEHFESNNPMPLYLVPFCPDGYGNHYCFDLYSHKIVFWEWDCNYSEGNPEIVYNYLGELIHEIFIDWTLESYNYDGSSKE